MTSRSRLRHFLRPVGIALVALALAGCNANFHPGSAAVVNGTVISQGEVDGVIDAACSYTAAFRKDNPDAQKLDRAQYRGIFLTGIIQAQITEDTADEMGLSVSDSQVDEAAVNGVKSIPDSLSDDERATLTTYFQDQTRSSILQAVIGKHAQDADVTNGSQLTTDEISAEKPFMATYYKRADVDLDPSFGTWDGSTVVSGTGSLSKLGNTLGTPSAAQQCG